MYWSKLGFETKQQRPVDFDLDLNLPPRPELADNSPQIRALCAARHDAVAIVLVQSRGDPWLVYGADARAALDAVDDVARLFEVVEDR